MKKTRKPRIGWKKCLWCYGTFGVGHMTGTALVKLKIVGDCVLDGEICGIETNKCRTSEAIVLDIQGAPKGATVFSWWGSMVKNRYFYKKGRTVKPRLPFSYSNNACGSGIHFFRTKKEAEAYNFV